MIIVINKECLMIAVMNVLSHDCIDL